MNLNNLHYVNVFRKNVDKYASKNALMHRTSTGWEGIDWKTFGQMTDTLSKALLAFGVQPQDTVGIFSQNMPQWTIADLATLQIRAITVPIYATNTAEQAAFVVNHAEIKMLFVGGEEQYDKALAFAEKSPSLQKIILMKDNIPLKEKQWSITWEDFIKYGASAKLDAQLQTQIENRSLNDLFTIIYTSGTTGDPKGVMLDYENLAHQLKNHDIRLKLSSEDVSLAFLPLSHVFERAWTFYSLYKGATNHYLENPLEIKSALLEVKPTVMCAVPRFYEKVFGTVYDMISGASLVKRLVFSFATRSGKQMLKAKQKHKKPSWFLQKAYQISEKLVFSKLKQSLGGRIRFMPCGGANLEPSIGRFFQAIGVNVKLGYGMTETLATVSCWDDIDFNLKSVGRLMPDTQMKIGEDNEILVKGGMVMKGYYKNPEETQKAFTQDGFLKTGDAGNLDKYNNVFITDRIKELMKTSNGKYIAPQHIEGKVGKDNVIDQIAVIADGRKFVSALIVPNFEVLQQMMADLNIKYKNTTDLIKNSQVIDFINKRLQKFQKDLPDYEKIKRFTLLPKAFSIDRNEITPTLKLKRKVIYVRYRKEIEAMYN
ncbi:AMP-dependent synthetase/ligase [Capnocytophaga canimorsus]|uniref:Long-chain fatty acid--CoA ligase n=1 Tax=Capnocytophaga canimorsus TaxID=28188 RepID=A0AAD0E835_9FLAO|nr:long-chain fatty acid--CoA ligase [Capnocytophaga canimorsus]ATA93425.1 long-chain fatty acid--CoA ligase [Capnocytophaga canimorsus]CEN47996.1 putative long-chain-fatty-acid--CoA ligase [Capnocytophaga canimorsus]VEJ18774.1 Long-chain-fatty-acid--CoA ligase FadD15 [Capnocytophaga canimorsus]